MSRGICLLIAQFELLGLRLAIVDLVTGHVWCLFLFISSALGL